LSSWCAASNAVSMPAATGGEAIIPVVHWGWLSSTTVVVSMQPPARCDRSAQEWEVVSRSDSLSWQEGWEEAAMEWTSTMAMKLKTKNDGKNQKHPLPGAPNVEVDLQHFHQCCYRSSPMCFFCWKEIWSLGR
jgi:hypothetical protein